MSASQAQIFAQQGEGPATALSAAQVELALSKEQARSSAQQLEDLAARLSLLQHSSQQQLSNVQEELFLSRQQTRSSAQESEHLTASLRALEQSSQQQISTLQSQLTQSEETVAALAQQKAGHLAVADTAALSAHQSLQLLETAQAQLGRAQANVGSLEGQTHELGAQLAASQFAEQTLTAQLSLSQANEQRLTTSMSVSQNNAQTLLDEVADLDTLLQQQRDELIQAQYAEQAPINYLASATVAQPHLQPPCRMLRLSRRLLRSDDMLRPLRLRSIRAAVCPRSSHPLCDADNTVALRPTPDVVDPPPAPRSASVTGSSLPPGKEHSPAAEPPPSSAAATQAPPSSELGTALDSLQQPQIVTESDGYCVSCVGLVGRGLGFMAKQPTRLAARLNPFSKSHR